MNETVDGVRERGAISPPVVETPRGGDLVSLCGGNTTAGGTRVPVAWSIPAPGSLRALSGAPSLLAQLTYLHAIARQADS